MLDRSTDPAAPRSRRHRFDLITGRQRLIGAGLVAVILVLGLALPSSASGSPVVSGTVREASGSAVGGGTVALLQPGTTTVTAQVGVAGDGTYSLTAPAGTYDLRATPPVTRPDLQPVVLSGLALSADATVDVVLVPSGSSTITGVLTDWLGLPLSNTIMRIGPDTVSTGADGAFSFTLANGTYSVFVSRSSNLDGLDVPPFFVLTTAQGFVVSADRSLGLVRLPRPAHKTIHVLDPGGQPVAGASVRDRAQRSVSAGFGTILGAAVASGSFSADIGYPLITTNALGDATLVYWPTASSSSITVDPPDTLALATTQTASFAIASDQSTTVTVAAASVVTGTLVDWLGAPVVGDLTIGLDTVTTSATGAFRFTSPDGAYQVRVGAGGAGGQMPASFALYTEPTFVVSGDASLGPVALPRPAAVTVTVVTPGGQPVAGASVVTAANPSATPGFATFLGAPVSSSSFYDGPVTTDASGQAVLHLWPSSSVSLRVTPPSGSGLSVTDPAPFAVTGDATRTITVATGSTLTGVLTDWRGTPIPGCDITIGTTTVRSAATTGAFSLSVQDGTYSVRLSNYSRLGTPTPHAGEAPAAFFLQTATSVVVSGSVDLGAVRLPRGVGVDVTVVGPTGSGIADAYIRDAAQRTYSGGLGTFLGATVSGGAFTPGQQLADSTGHGRLYYWPTTTNTLTIDPPVAAALPTIVLPSVSLPRDTALLVAYQADGTAAIGMTGNGDTYTTPRNTTLDVPASGLLSNDVVAAGATATALTDTGPTHGSLALRADGSFTYVPAAGYAGSDSFTYRLSDGTRTLGPVTVAITVLPTPATVSLQVSPAPSQVVGQPVLLTAPASTAGTVTFTYAQPGIAGGAPQPIGTASVVSGFATLVWAVPAGLPPASNYTLRAALTPQDPVGYTVAGPAEAPYAITSASAAIVLVDPALLPLMNDLLAGSGLVPLDRRTDVPTTTTQCGFAAPRTPQDAQQLLLGNPYTATDGTTATPTCAPAALTQ